METIIYRNGRNKEILNENDISDDATYNKEYYIDNKPIKTESYFLGKLIGLALYVQPSDAPEKLLRQYIGLKAITLHHHRLSIGKYDYYEIEHYEYLKLIYSKVEVFCPEGTIAVYWISPEYYGTNGKVYYLSSKDGEQEKKIQVGYHKNGELKNVSIPGEKAIESVEEFILSGLEEKYGIDTRYYGSLFPLIPGIHEALPKRKVRYISSFSNEPLTLQEALNTEYLTKKVYEDDVLVQTDKYQDGKFYKRRLYFYGESYNKELFHPGVYNVAYYNPKEINNYVVWEANHFNPEGKLSKRCLEVRDHKRTKIAVQQISLETEKVIKTKKYSKEFFDDSEGYKPFVYDKNGTICKKVKTYNYGYETYLISEMRENGFFDTEYGHYFLEPEPLVPYVKGTELVPKKVVYKNHFGGVIDETETKLLYEYYKETYHNGYLKKVEHHGTSRWETEVYEDMATDTSKAYGLYFFNLKNVNGYRIYDAYGKDSYRDEILTGILVQDIYGREVSRVLHGYGKVQFGRKILYDNYMPLLSGSEETHVLYDEDGKVNLYRRVDTINNRIHNSTRSAYESESSFQYENVAKPYYRSLEELVPPQSFVRDIRLNERPVTSHDDTTGVRNITGFYSTDNKLRHILDGHEKRYFIPKDEDIVTAVKALRPHRYTHFYFDIIEQGNNVFCHYFHASGFLVQMKISKITYEAEVRITPEQREITVKLADIYENKYWYNFYKNGTRVYFTSFHTKELVRQLLQAM